MTEVTHATERVQLAEERERVLGQLRQLGRAPGTEELNYDEGFADTAAATAERGEVDALAAQLLESLSDIDDALAKIEAGTYGRCESCGNEISSARLEAMPTARLCIVCASQRR